MAGYSISKNQMKSMMLNLSVRALAIVDALLIVLSSISAAQSAPRTICPNGGEFLRSGGYITILEAFQ